MSLRKLIYLLLATIVLRHVLALRQSFVDIPYRDSWQIIQANLGQAFPLDWFLRAHNEHLIFLTKFQVWLLYRVNSWNVVTHLWLNLCLYFVAVCSLYKLFRGYGILIVVSLIFLFSNLNWENHSWEFQSCFHFFVLFLILTIMSLSNNKFYLAAMFNLLMVLSFSAAVGASLAIALLLFFRKGVSRQISILMLIPSALYFFNPGSTKIVWPLRLEFWDFFFNLISFGFGFETYSWLLGLACLLLVLIPFVMNLKAGSLSDAHFLSLACLASLSLIAVGRAGNSDLHIWSKGSRYFEISSLLVPCALVLWHDFFSMRHVTEKRMLIYSSLFLLVPFIGTLDNWNYSIYKWIGEQKTIGRECMRESRAGTIYCKTLWAGESSKQLELAKSLGLSFLEKSN